MVDVDSTLYDAAPHFADKAKEMGFDWPLDANYWLHGKHLGMSFKEMGEMFDHVHSHEVVQTLKPYPDCKNELVAVSGKFEIWYVSNRNPKKEAALRTWIMRCGFPQGHNVYTSYDKQIWIEENKPLFVIDDRVRTLFFQRQTGNIGIALEHPWNINLSNDEVPGIYICKDWMEIGKIMSTLSENV